MTSSPLKIVRVTTSKMRVTVGEEAARLLQEYERGLKGSDDAARSNLVAEMKTLLDKEVETFCTSYSKRFTKCAVGIGCAVGGSILSLAGGVVGAAVAGTVLATVTEVAVLSGVVGGSLTFGAIGTGLGAGVGGVIGHKEKVKGQTTDPTCGDNGVTSEDTQQLVPKPE